ncbi:hypothetical protein L1887_11370 [Cichorium endivia]|nr:hypothetical protein L1887_11370 [Cichorium endivia]
MSQTGEYSGRNGTIFRSAEFSETRIFYRAWIWSKLLDQERRHGLHWVYLAQKVVKRGQKPGISQRRKGTNGLSTSWTGSGPKWAFYPFARPAWILRDPRKTRRGAVLGIRGEHFGELGERFLEDLFTLFFTWFVIVATHMLGTFLYTLMLVVLAMLG